MKLQTRLARVEHDLLLRSASAYLDAAEAVLQHGDEQLAERHRARAQWLDARAAQVAARRRCTGIAGGVF